MTSSVSVRSAQPHDYAAWRPLWDGYNAFYGRFGATALPEHITQTTWQRLHDAAEPMLCLVAQDDASGDLLGLAHCVFHRSMTRIEPVCYLSDLFTREAARGRGVDLSTVAQRVRDGITGARPVGEIGFSVQRGGGIVGEHSVVFAAEDEILTLSHSARDRGLFARGAVEAARWVAGRPPGAYDMQDVLGLKAGR